ncbi:MAG: GNAT family N-acetyltransferase [Chloroflexota bacterium]
MQSASISLLPLSGEHHAPALQYVYDLTPSYWRMYGLASSAPDQAARDIQEGAETPGRYMMGIVRQIAAKERQPAIQPETQPAIQPATQPETQIGAGPQAELVGLADLRLHWPQRDIGYLGMLMVAGPYHRQGIGTQTWQLLRPWLADTAQMKTMRLGVEQFNIRAMKFFESIGFHLTGEANRVKSGERLIKLMYMEQTL